MTSWGYNFLKYGAMKLLVKWGDQMSHRMGFGWGCTNGILGKLLSWKEPERKKPQSMVKIRRTLVNRCGIRRID